MTIFAHLLAALFALLMASAPLSARQEKQKVYPAGEALIVIRQQLVNAIIDGVFSMSAPPVFPLTPTRSTNRACPSEVTVLKELNGVKTSVRFAPGRISVPIAFKGNYEVPLIGCLEFSGWADSDVRLSFDRERQMLVGRVEVKTISVDGIPGTISASLKDYLQRALDRRFNPLKLVTMDQLSSQMPLPAQPGKRALRLQAKEIRTEVVSEALNVFIIYEVLARE